MEKQIKKVAMYIDSMYHGGAQRVMANLAEYFDKQGVKVLLIDDFVPKENILVYDVPESVEHIHLREKLDGNPVLKNIERIKNLRNILKKEQPDIMLSFLGSPNMRMLVAANGLKCKKIVSVRNDPNREYAPSGVKKWLTRQIFKTADGCVFQTHQAAEYFPESVQQRAQIIMNPVGEVFYETERKAEQHHVITVGRFAPQKNHKLLIDAFAQIADQFPEENLVIYGEATESKGTARTELENLIQEKHLEDRILLPGDTKAVAEKLAECKLFVLSSDFEGMPNALLEAMTVGTPVISTDCPCGGPQEVIRNKENGVLVPCGDVNQLASAMASVLQDDEYAKKLGNAARETAMQFRAEEVYAQWHRYFLKVLNEE